MSDHITLTGILGTEPEYRKLGANADIARLTFRLATSERRQKPDGEWEDANTNWFSVTAFGRLADNANGVFTKGERVLLTGKLRINEYTRKDGTTGTNAEILAAHLGRDLAYSSKARSAPQRDETDAPANSASLPTQEPGESEGQAFAPANYEVAAPF